MVNKIIFYAVVISILACNNKEVCNIEIVEDCEYKENHLYNSTWKSETFIQHFENGIYLKRTILNEIYTFRKGLLEINSFRVFEFDINYNCETDSIITIPRHNIDNYKYHIEYRTKNAMKMIETNKYQLQNTLYETRSELYLTRM